MFFITPFNRMCAHVVPFSVVVPLSYTSAYIIIQLSQIVSIRCKYRYNDIMIFSV